MIRYIKGKLVEKSAGEAIVENAGIGYSVLISANTANSLPEPGSMVMLTTYLYVREDQLTLFGFGSTEERDLFLSLISISGIGAKGAIKILSGISPERFMEVITTENVDYLTSLPGIGKKSAQRIIVELREKLPALQKDKAMVSGLDKQKQDEVLTAFNALGLSSTEARRRLESTSKKMSSKKIKAISTEDLVREALKISK